MVSATIHLANQDWGALVDDFVALGFLPPDCDKGGWGREGGAGTPPVAGGSGKRLPDFRRKHCSARCPVGPASHSPAFACAAPAPAGRVVGVMSKILGPYLRGGGAKAYRASFKELSTDLLVG